MTIKIRWPKIPRRTAISLLMFGVFALLVNQPIVALLCALTACVLAVRDMKIVASGGGFRPLRVSEMIEFNAADHLDAYDQEQAMLRAKMSR